MQWLERWVLAVTRRPCWIMAAGAMAALVALQMDGVLWTTLGRSHPATEALALANAALGIAGIVLACLAGHGIWFRLRWRAAVQAAQPVALPGRPWETTTGHRPVAPRYLRSITTSAMVFGAAVLGIFSQTPLIAVGLVVFWSCVALAVVTLTLRAWVRAEMQGTPQP